MKRAIAIGLFLAAGQLTGGCATLTGLATGAFTGAVDAPAEVYRAQVEVGAQRNVLVPLPLDVPTTSPTTRGVQ